MLRILLILLILALWALSLVDWLFPLVGTVKSECPRTEKEHALLTKQVLGSHTLDRVVLDHVASMP